MIRLKELPDPLTDASRESLAARRNQPTLSGYAESAASRTLLREIRRYASGEASGRSFLIAGHRGAGKSTMIRIAVEQAQEAAREGQLELWPILISLHGPDILDAKNAERPDTPPKAKADGDATDDSQTPAAATLRALAKNLHRALADELGGGMRRHAELVSDPARRAEWLELAAQLEQELDQAPAVSTLRERWRHAGALDSGVVRAGRGKFSANLGAGQGVREVLALASAIEAFLVVAGKAKNVDAREQQKGRHDEQKSEHTFAGKDLFNPLLGVVTGGVLGAGLLESDVSPWLAALVATGSTLAATATLNRTSTVTAKQEEKQNREYVWDTSLASLDRMLPVLIDRMVRAGLAPILVVDELDKVEGLPRKMGDLITHLKHFVTEKAFFCFLCDRKYFEQVERSGRSGLYGKEYTFFTDRLFVQYLPKELRSYLATIVTRDGGSTEARDLELLCHVVLQGSRLSPIGLRRELNPFFDADGKCVLPEGFVVAEAGYQTRGFMQLAIEHVLGERTGVSPLQRRMQQDGKFARLVCDALYYPAVRWLGGKQDFGVSSAILREYLERVLNEDAIDPAEDPEPTPPDPERLKVGPRDLALLHESLLDLLKHLAAPGELLGPTPGTFNPTLLDSLGFLDGERWYWRFDRFGVQPAAWVTAPAGTVTAPSTLVMPATPPVSLPVVPAVTALREEVAPNPPPVEELAVEEAVPAAAGAEGTLEGAVRQAEEIDRIEAALVRAGLTLETFADPFGLIELHPPWPRVLAAVQRVTVKRARLEDVREDMSVVGAFWRMLNACGDDARRALLLGQCHSASAHPSFRVAEVSDLFSFGRIPRVESSQMMRIVFEEFLQRTPPLDAVLSPALAVPGYRLDQVLEKSAALRDDPSLTGTIPRVPPFPADTERWAAFLSRNSYGREQIYPITLQDLLITLGGHRHLNACVDNHSVGALWTLTDLGDESLTRAVLSFLGVGMNLRPLHRRLGERVVLLDPAVARDFLPSTRHACAILDVKLANPPPLTSASSLLDTMQPTLALLERTSAEARLVETWRDLASADPRWNSVPLVLLEVGENRPNPPRHTVVANNLDDAVEAAVRIKHDTKFAQFES